MIPLLTLVNSHWNIPVLYICKSVELSRIGIWYLGRGEDEGELEEGPGPDGEHGEAELFVGVHLLVLIATGQTFSSM